MKSRKGTADLSTSVLTWLLGGFERFEIVMVTRAVARALRDGHGHEGGRSSASSPGGGQANRLGPRCRRGLRLWPAPPVPRSAEPGAAPAVRRLGQDR